MESSLLRILKEGNSQEVRQALRQQHKSPPAELLLPFVLRKCLQKKELDLKTIRYVKESFGMFTTLASLGTVERKKSAHVHRSALVMEAVFVLDRSSDYLEVGPLVMSLFKEFMYLYSSTKQAKLFNYFAMVCNRRTRFINFKKDSPAMLANLEKRLKRRALPLLNDFISRM